jgi:hypothetical protein
MSSRPTATLGSDRMNHHGRSARVGARPGRPSDNRSIAGPWAARSNVGPQNQRAPGPYPGRGKRAGASHSKATVELKVGCRATSEDPARTATPRYQKPARCLPIITDALTRLSSRSARSLFAGGWHLAPDGRPQAVPRRYWWLGSDPENSSASRVFAPKNTGVDDYPGTSPTDNEGRLLRRSMSKPAIRL